MKENELVDISGENYINEKVTNLYDIEQTMLKEIKTILKDKTLETKEKIMIIKEARMLLKENSFIITPKQDDNVEEYIDYIETFEDIPTFEDESNENSVGIIENK